jgi:hypothetical protein
MVMPVLQLAMHPSHGVALKVAPAVSPICSTRIWSGSRGPVARIRHNQLPNSN